MHKELCSIRLIRNYMEEKGLIKKNISNIDEIFDFFKYLTLPESSVKFNSLYILNYINQYIADDEVAKRKTSARVFEDLLAIILIIFNLSSKGVLIPNISPFKCL